MLRLRDIMTSDVVTITPDTTVRDALELLGQHHMSGVPVVSGDKIVGVVTATDLLTFAASLPSAPTARETHEEVGVPAEQPVEDEDLERELAPAGAFFSELWDDAAAEATERVVSAEGPEWNVLEEHDVTEVMTRPPLVTLAPNEDVETAADLMREKGIHRVLVTDGDKLVGIVSALDVVKAAADHKFRTRTYVFDHRRDADDAE